MQKRGESCMTWAQVSSLSVQIHIYVCVYIHIDDTYAQTLMCVSDIRSIRNPTLLYYQVTKMDPLGPSWCSESGPS